MDLALVPNWPDLHLPDFDQATSLGNDASADQEWRTPGRDHSATTKRLIEQGSGKPPLQSVHCDKLPDTRVQWIAPIPLHALGAVPNQNPK
jgi:hypothetical protein